jgi:dolichol-phosphate mannosyltransferase
MWREWGRSVDLADVTDRARQLIDIAFLALVQAAPLLVVTAGFFAPLPVPLVAVNVGLLGIRVGMLAVLAPSYERRGVAWWLNWLADAAAVFRVAVSTFRRPVTWRGRAYRDVAQRR